MRLTGAQALVEVLAAEKIAFAFGVAGGKLAPLLHAINATPGIRYVGTRHEANAAMMAAAAFAGSGHPAVALAEMGPGALNLASGAGVAFNNNLAALLITSNQHRAAAYPHAGMFMDLDTLALLRPVTKWNAVVHDPRRIPELARRAFREALSGRPGPVHLDIPQDVLGTECEFAGDEFAIAPASYRFAGALRASGADIVAAAGLLREARRPLIVAGGGVITSGAEESLRRLADKLRAPVVPTQMALGVIPTDSPHFIGHGGIIGGDAVPQAFAQADLIIAIGCRFSSWMWDELGPLVRRHHRVININIDPAALGAPIHSVALQADAGLALADILDELDASANLLIDGEWLTRLRKARAAYEQKLLDLAGETFARDASRGAGACHRCKRCRTMRLPFTTAATQPSGATTSLLCARAARDSMIPAWPSSASACPTRSSLQLQHPDKPIFNITGDGAFGFTLQELDTARRYELPVINLIHNNAAWGVIRAGQKAQFGFELGTSLADTDYAAIARGFGCFGETARQAADIGPALQARAGLGCCPR